MKKIISKIHLYSLLLIAFGFLAQDAYGQACHPAFHTDDWEVNPYSDGDQRSYAGRNYTCTPAGGQGFRCNQNFGGNPSVNGNWVDNGACGAASAPTLTTSAASSVSCTGATLNLNISDAGGANVTKGFFYSTSAANVTAAALGSFAGCTKVDHANVSTTTGDFSYAITGLTLGETYYYKAYGTNSGGDTYGANQSFTMDDVPTVDAAVAPGGGTATCSTISPTGNVSSNGGAAITEMGFVYQLTGAGDPDITDSKFTNAVGGGAGGALAGPITGLAASTSYEVRSYATNTCGTSYSGNTITTSTDVPCVPTVTTTAASSIFCESATLGGEVTDEGGGTVTARGVCYGTAINPDITGDKIDIGSGSGSFSDAVSGLTGGQTYHIRAYATNATGTSYGADLTFTTAAAPCVPVLTTDAASAISCVTATSGGNVTSDGGFAVSARGVCWNTGGSPTTADSKTTDGSGTGAFASSLTGLTVSTTYYIRAYATNGVSTSYGPQVSFTTLGAGACLPVVPTTDAGSAITAFTATTGGNVTSDGGSAITERGVVYSTSSGPTTADSKETAGGTTGAFVSNLTGLTDATTYYVRAYATNGNGTTYGPEISFTTTALPKWYSCPTLNEWTLTDGDCSPAAIAAAGAPGNSDEAVISHDWSNPAYVHADTYADGMGNMAFHAGAFACTAWPLKLTVKNGGRVTKQPGGGAPNTWPAGSTLNIESGGAFYWYGSLTFNSGSGSINNILNEGSMAVYGSFTNQIIGLNSTGQFCMTGDFGNIVGGTFNGISDASLLSYTDVTTPGRYNNVTPIRAYVSAFDPGDTARCLDGAAILPVEIIEFKVNVEDNVAGLSWITGSETNSSHFVLETSTNGKNWDFVSKTTAAGNSSQVLRYFSQHEASVHDAMRYYRLKQVDLDGKIHYSSIIVAKFSKRGSIAKAFDNGKDIVVQYIPSGKGINSTDFEFRIFDINGRLINDNNFTAQYNSHEVLFTTPSVSLENGFYLIRIIVDSEVYSVKVLVNR